MNEKFWSGKKNPKQTNINKTCIKFTIMHIFFILIFQKVLDIVCSHQKFMSFHIDIYNSIDGNLTANSRDEELESISTFDEEECDMDILMERGMFITKRTF